MTQHATFDLNDTCRPEDRDNPHILLAVKDTRRANAYIDAVGCNAELTVLEGLREIPQILRQKPFKGILIDVALNVRATYMEKVKLADSLESMPSATLNLDPRHGSIRLFMLNQLHGSARTVHQFIELCATFQPQIIFSKSQELLHLNLTLSRSPGFDAGTENTCTIYVSAGGCFVFTSNAAMYQPQEPVWLDFVGLTERKPVVGKVCWRCEWGMSHNVPGIYVSYESILERQHAEIRELAGRTHKGDDVWWSAHPPT